MTADSNGVASLQPMAPAAFDASLLSVLPASATRMEPIKLSADPLADLLGGSLVSQSLPLQPFTSSAVATTTSLSSLSLYDLKEKVYICYDKKGLKIELAPRKDSSTNTFIKATFIATSSVDISDIILQVAVPKVIHFFYYNQVF